MEVKRENFFKLCRAIVWVLLGRLMNPLFAISVFLVTAFFNGVASNYTPRGLHMKPVTVLQEIKHYDPYKYFYIDRFGQVVVDAGNYQAAGSFSEGLAPVLLANKGWGYIDKTGKVTIEPQFEQALSFSEDLAGVQVGGKWGFIDRTGKIVIDPKYDLVNPFSEGIAVAVKGELGLKAGDLWAKSIGDSIGQLKEVLLIDRNGKTILSPKINRLQLNIHEKAKFSEGLIDAYDCKKKRIGFIDRSGRFVVEPMYSEAAPFSEGIARVAIMEAGEEKVGFIDHSGQFVIPPRFNTDFDFRNSTDFSEQLASLTEGLRPTVSVEGKSVYIDKKGEIVLLTDFSCAGRFRDGLAVVYDSEKGKSGYIDKSGKLVIPLQYDLAEDFHEGLAAVAVLNRLNKPEN